MSPDSNNKKTNSSIKKYLPILSLTILTISLLIYFGLEQFDKSAETNKNNLLSDLYSKTLKPIFTSEQLTKEDVLNFALYNNLPVDKKENKILEVKDDLSGNEVIEIRKASIKENTDNYSKFVEKMQLNVDQKKELDELLEEFKQNITSTIFSDDQKTLAVDSRIGLLHRILRTEIFDFISRINAKENVDLVYTESTLKNFNRIIEKEKSKSIRSYILFTPDTVLQSKAEFLRAEPHLPIGKGESLAPPIIKIIQNKEIVQNENDLTFKIDSNFIKVFLTDDFLKDLEIDNYTELKSVLDSSSNKFEFSIGVPDEESMKLSISTSIPDSIEEFHYEFNLNDFEEFISSSMQIPTNSQIEDWIEFGIKMDSLAIKLHELHLDTLDNIEYED